MCSTLVESAFVSVCCIIKSKETLIRNQPSNPRDVAQWLLIQRRVRILNLEHSQASTARTLAN
jgi:hypothetical protein